jgi:hypothetical protein
MRSIVEAISIIIRVESVGQSVAVGKAEVLCDERSVVLRSLRSRERCGDGQ